MKQRIIAAFMCLMLLFVSSAGAQEIDPFYGMTDINGMPLTAPPEEFYLRGREALMLLSQGETELALEKLAFVFDVEGGLTEETFREFTEGLMLLSPEAVQVDVALCWLDELGVWHLGIPLVEPISWDVEVLVLDSRDLNIYCGYSLANWGMLEEIALTASHAYWNLEYLPDALQLWADE